GEGIAIVEKTLEVPFHREMVFDHIDLGEAIALGQRVAQFQVEVKDETGWREIAGGATIGNRRVLQIDPTEGVALRLTILNSNGPVLISRFAVWESH
ncbi:MAG: hypothetical protein KF812_12325, partial [Fimbriimonadaceae bacterium]|nr:hypothetical protein [Fimbriimonadaceae bacterium]